MVWTTCQRLLHSFVLVNPGPIDHKYHTLLLCTICGDKLYINYKNDQETPELWTNVNWHFFWDTVYISETMNDVTGATTDSVLVHTAKYRSVYLYTCRLSCHAVPVGQSNNQISPRFGADVLGTPRPPFSVDTKPLPSVVKTPRRRGAVPLWIWPQAPAAEARAYCGMSGRPKDTADAVSM